VFSRVSGVCVSYYNVSAPGEHQVLVCVFYYCRTYYKSCSRVGGGRVEDMCYERRRAEACVDLD
jgi:hypothetical protein